MKATGRVNSPSRRNRPPNVSRIPAMPGSDAIAAVPPPGMIAAGNANSLAVPNCMKRNAATIRRTLSRYGARVGHFAVMLGAVIVRVSLLVEGGPIKDRSSARQQASVSQAVRACRESAGGPAPFELVHIPEQDRDGPERRQLLEEQRPVATVPQYGRGEI